MSLNGIIHGARALSYHLRLQEVTANNLANSGTDAFKVDRLAAHQELDGAPPTPVHSTDLRQGTLRATARPLDVALDGPGFLVVDTPAGERLTRGGSLTLDADGRLVDAHGDPLLGELGPLVLNGMDVRVEADGTLQVDGAPAGQLRVVLPEKGARLLKEGSGRFRCEGALEPAAPGRTRLRQGSIEDPNFDPLLATVDLVTIQRAYAATIEAVRVMDGVLGTVTGEVGKV
jgi:flagellar basal body rod protein FlgG